MKVLTDNEREAQEQLASRLEDLDAMTACTNVDELEDGELDPYCYGLSWSKYLTNWERGETTYKHVLSTGGPHEEFQVTFDNETHEITDLKFVSLPWFDRVEIELTVSQQEVAEAFYEAFYADLLDT